MSFIAYGMIVKVRKNKSTRDMLHKTLFTIGVAIFAVLAPVGVLAQTSSSPNYRADQTFFGTGGEADMQSASYRSRASVGELGIGELNSDNFRAFAGFNTTDEPFLEFVVLGQNIDLGFLDFEDVTTAQGQFYVRAWQSGGYNVRTEAQPPTNVSNNHQLDTPTSPTSSQVGTEQFGINLVANTDPEVGEELIQQPDDTFAFGEVAPDYAQQNNFLYNPGDVIAFSEESTSVTVYTISYIFNISNITPSGQYNFEHILVATGAY